MMRWAGRWLPTKLLTLWGITRLFLELLVMVNLFFPFSWWSRMCSRDSNIYERRKKNHNYINTSSKSVIYSMMNKKIETSMNFLPKQRSYSLNDKLMFTKNNRECSVTTWFSFLNCQFYDDQLRIEAIRWYHWAFNMNNVVHNIHA